MDCLSSERNGGVIFNDIVHRFNLNNTPNLKIFQEYYFLLQLEIQNFDIVCSPVWTSRDRCCDLPSMVSINEPKSIQKNVINSEFNNITIRLLLNLILKTPLNHSCQSSQSTAPLFQSFVSETVRL